MFLRKIFSSKNKFTWVFIDLLIVIIGVYGAFLIQNYAEGKKNDKERDRVLTALKFELEFFRYRMFETSAGMQKELENLRAFEEKGTYSNFSDYRFIEPQYDYQTIEYALRLQNTEIIDFELYDVMQSLYVEIKKIEHVERLLTETSRRYQSLPENLDKNTSAYQLIWVENYDNFRRFLTLINDRAEISLRIADASTHSLPIVNTRLGMKKARAIEKEIILKNMDRARSEDEAVFLGKKFFPNFSEEEMRKFYRQAKEKEVKQEKDVSD